jgi:hypothetical protein
VTSLQFTAYDEAWGGALADMRTYLKPATIRTSRAAVVMPSDSALPAHMSKRELAASR